jgi:uracil-DNA glycosylase
MECGIDGLLDRKTESKRCAVINMNEQKISDIFRKVIACEQCDNSTSKKIQRDELENIPQPGFVGKSYWNNRVLLIGQNPGVAPDRFYERDQRYTKALRDFEEEGSLSAYQRLYDELMEFVPDWPVQKNYFPLAECGFDLHDIAYCNRVRCRTSNNTCPAQRLVRNCSNHLLEIVDVLKPRVIVFIGKWAYMQSFELLSDLNIKLTYMNRSRSLNTAQRKENQKTVVELIKKNAQVV